MYKKPANKEQNIRPAQTEKPHVRGLAQAASTPLSPKERQQRMQHPITQAHRQRALVWPLDNHLTWSSWLAHHPEYSAESTKYVHHTWRRNKPLSLIPAPALHLVQRKMTKESKWQHHLMGQVPARHLSSFPEYNPPRPKPMLLVSARPKNQAQDLQADPYDSSSTTSVAGQITQDPAQI